MAGCETCSWHVEVYTASWGEAAGGGLGLWPGQTWSTGCAGGKNPGPFTTCVGTEVWFSYGGEIGSGSYTVNLDVNLGGTEGQHVVSEISGNGVFVHRIINTKKAGTVTVKATLIGDCPAPDGSHKEETVEAQFNFDGGGCAKCSEGSMGNPSAPPSSGTADIKVSSLDAKWFLGADSDGNHAGVLALRANASSSSLSQPSSLATDFIGKGVTKVLSGGNIRQIRMPQGLASVETVNSYKYNIKFIYNSQVGSADGSGIYSYSGSPFVTWVVENPDTTSTNNRIWITEQRSGQSDKVWKYTYTTTNYKWELLRPDGATETNYRERIDNTYTNQVDQVWDGGTLLQQTVKTWKYVSGIASTLLVTNVAGDATTFEKTTYSYNSSNMVERIDYPDGNWVYYKYDEALRVTNEFRPFGLNSPPSAGTTPSVTGNLCRLIEYRYSLNSTEDGEDYDSTNRVFIPRRVIEYVPIVISGTAQAYEVSRLYRKVEELSTETRKAATAGDDWDTAEPVSLEYFYNTQDFKHGRLSSVSHHDGTATLYSYSQDGSGITTVESKGVIDEGDWTEPGSISTGVEMTLRQDTQNRIVSSSIRHFTPSSSVISDGYTNTWLSADALGRSYETVSMDGRTNTFQYACCGLESLTDKDGIQTLYDYNSLKQEVAQTRVRGATSIKYTNVLDLLGRKLMRKRIGSDGSIITNAQLSYDILGRVVYLTNALGGITTNLYSIYDGRRRHVTLYPDGGTKTNDFYRDGQLEKVSGTAVASVRYERKAGMDNSIIPRLYATEIKLDTSWADTTEWKKTLFDMFNRPYKVIFPDASTSSIEFNTKGQKIRSIDPDGVWTLFRYNDEGDLIVTAIDVDHDQYADDYEGGQSGSDRVSKRIHYYLASGAGGNSRGINIRVDEESIWTTTSSANTALIRKTESSTDGLHVWDTTYRDQSTPLTTYMRTVYSSGGTRYLTNAAPNSTTNITQFSYGRPVSVTEKDSSNAQVTKTDINYDSHGRTYQSVDARNGATTYTYNNADQLATVTTPLPGTGQPAQITSTSYNTSLRAETVTQPDGTIVTNLYTGMGLLKKTSGARTYPVEYTYDAQGRMKTMKTWQNFSSDSGTATTTWNYDSIRGWLSNKRHNDNLGPDYVYTVGGRLHTRTWARTNSLGNRVTITYTNSLSSGSWHGDVSEIRYSNDPESTSTVTYTYDRRGRKATMTSASDLITFSYYDNGVEGTNTHGTGVLNGYVVKWGYNSSMQLTSLDLNTATALSQSFTYDNAGRLYTATDGAYNATYSYASNSKLVSQVLYKNNSTTRLTTIKEWDYLNRLRLTRGTPSSSSELPTVFAYSYNNANQRINATMSDGSYWVYSYDSLGQVVSGDRFWADGTPVAGQQYDYAFDSIGNRTSAKFGGDSNGQNLQSATYTPNLLNQYSQRTVPAVASVLGIATAAATVTVNSNSVYRKGEYFWKELTVTNSTASVWLSITNAAVNGANVASSIGNQYIPKTAEVFNHDLDGNLTADGRWNYTWDAENRLIKMVAATASGPQQRIVFRYDPLGRRIHKQVWNNTAGTGTPVLDTKFIYEGWNLLGETDALNTHANIRTYLWGTDMSASRQGAGGVGGLLAVKNSSGVAQFTVFDGSGNVSRSVAGDDGTYSATYEYGPFGNPIRASGAYSSANPIRFSTKYRDSETELIYYGHRFYNTQTGGWLSRDQKGEEAGFNLRGFCQNDPIGNIDRNGMDYLRVTGIASFGAWVWKFWEFSSDEWEGASIFLRKFEDLGFSNFKWDYLGCGMCVEQIYVSVYEVYATEILKTRWLATEKYYNAEYDPKIGPIVPPRHDWETWIPIGYQLMSQEITDLGTQVIRYREEKPQFREYRLKNTIPRPDIPLPECGELFGPPIPPIYTIDH